jgi:hypothetical protein
MAKPFKHDPMWAKAKQVCRLNMEEIQMAKEVGLSPKALMKNQPSPSQRWKLPVKLWIRELHGKRFGSRAKAVNRPAKPAPPASPAEDGEFDEDIPF